MNQRELADALGIDGALVSRLKARGMPVDSVQAAQDWRRKNVNPYYRSQQAPAAPRAPAQDWTQPPPTGDMMATISAIELELKSSAVMPSTALLAVVAGLASAAFGLLSAGKPLGTIEPALRAAMSAVPAPIRDQTEVSLLVYQALCATVVEYVESTFESREAREADRLAFQAGGDVAAADMGRFWYQVAAGEVRVPT